MEKPSEKYCFFPVLQSVFPPQAVQPPTSYYANPTSHTQIPRVNEKIYPDLQQVLVPPLFSRVVHITHPNADIFVSLSVQLVHELRNYNPRCEQAVQILEIALI